MEELDQTDLRILELLQQNARITNRELSKQLGISVTPIYERVKKLEKKGYIRTYVTLLDNKRIGKGLTAFISATLKDHTKAQVDAFVARVQALPEVMECYYMAGHTDFFIKVMVRDMEEYHRFIMDKMANMDDCVAHLQSAFVMSEVKYTTAFSLA